MTCHVSLVSRKNWFKKMLMFEAINEKSSQTTAVQQVENMSMILSEPVLARFPFVGKRSCVDLYSVFWLESIHNLSLGTYCLLKECVWNILNDESRNTCALKLQTGYCKLLKSARKLLPSTWSRFLFESHKSLTCCGIPLDFQKLHQTNNFNGFFSDAGLKNG